MSPTASLTALSAIFIDEIYLLFQHEYSANFLFTLWKRVRKYGAYATGITQNVDDLLQSHTARTMLANSEFLIMLNQASTDRIELAKLLNISDLQLSYITNVDAGHGLIKVGSSLVPFANKFPKNTKLYKLMTTKPGDKNFWEKHKTVSFDTLTDRQTYEVIAVFKTVVYTDSPDSFKYYHFINAETDEDFTAYVEKCKELSLYDTGVTAKYGDKLLTLSTCEYSRTNGRLVVVAKLINE